MHSGGKVIYVDELHGVVDDSYYLHFFIIMSLLESYVGTYSISYLTADDKVSDSSGQNNANEST